MSSPEQYCLRCGKLGSAAEFKGHECDPEMVEQQEESMREIEAWDALSPDEKYADMLASLEAAARRAAESGQSAEWIEGD